MKHFTVVLLLLSFPFALQASDCNDTANEIRMSDRIDDALDVLDDCL